MAKFTGHTITSDSALGSAVIQRSLRFNRSDSTKLTRTFGSAGNRRTFTYSTWIKLSVDGNTNAFFSGQKSGDGFFKFMFRDDGRIEVNTSETGSDDSSQLRTTAHFRDPSAWYHVVVAYDTTQGTASDRVKVYVNGTQQTAFDTGTYPSQNHQHIINIDGDYEIGNQVGTSNYFSGYMTEIHFVDGYQYDSSYFGFTDSQTGIWMPKRYEGTYGTTGFYLDFSDNSSTTTLGIDKSPNGNDWTTNNFATTDAVKDSPTNNFCTHNPLDDDYSSTSTFSEGNLKIVRTGNNHGSTRGTIGMSSGKWYFEYCYTSTTNSGAAPWVGVCNSTADITGFRTSGMWNYGSSSGQYLVRDGTSYDWGSAISGGTVLGVAIDMDNKKIWIAENNTWFGSSNNDTDGNPSTGANPTDTFADSDIPDGNLYPQMGSYSYDAIKANFGQDSTFSGTKTAQGNTDDNGIGDFFYAPPTGFKALCSKNLLPNVPSIKPQKHFQPLLYTGQNTSSLYNVTGLEFAPDFVWAKARNDTIGHIFIDTVRGDDKQVEGNIDSAEVTRGTPSYRFLKDGFAVSTGGNMNNPVNYVAFCWKAGGAAVSNTDGDITSSVSVNEEAGFSIATYTGTYSSGSNSATTIGHGLGKVPKCAFFKKRSDTGNWMVYHEGLGNTHNLYLNTSDTPQDDAHAFFDTSPTSSLFTFGISGFLNASSQTYVGYFWAEIPGYSKFGTYTGNASSDGTFVHLGFRPALIIFKSTSASENWQMKNSKQVGYNDQNHSFFCNNENVEYTTAEMDFLSNGFKLRNNGGGSNGSGETFVYMAWAEQSEATPFATSPNSR